MRTAMSGLGALLVATMGICGASSVPASAQYPEIEAQLVEVLPVLASSEAGSCTSSNERLCLLDRRFEVTVQWRNQFNGESGRGKAAPHGNFTGFFHFTDPANLELMIKLIDFGDVIKVFYGQLTNLEFTITVKDTVRGTTRRYQNANNNCGAIDGGAFPSVAGWSDVVMYKGLEGPLSGNCVPTARRLCYLGGRFAAEVTWRNQYNGASGRANATRLSDLSGLFYYEDSRNVELLTKALDFGDRVLFIYGALSDLEYTIELTDTVSGQTKTYRNEAGRFCGGLDNDAFPVGQPALCEARPPGNRQLAFYYVLESNRSSMQEVELYLDDRLIARYSGAATAARAFTPIVEGVGAGPHCVTVRVVRQATSPTRYSLGSSVGFGNLITVNRPGSASEIIFLPRATFDLRTGGVYTQRVTIP